MQREENINFYNRVRRMDNANEIVQDFVFGLWRLWKNRNEAVFHGVHRHPMEILEVWKKNIGEFRGAKLQVAAPSCRFGAAVREVAKGQKVAWQKPEFATVKVYTDAAWCKESLRAGVGWVARDFAGLLRAAGGSGDVHF
ncbi:hypothetical protein ACFX11_004094 [Malus domestica]